MCSQQAFFSTVQFSKLPATQVTQADTKSTHTNTGSTQGLILSLGEGLVYIYTESIYVHMCHVATSSSWALIASVSRRVFITQPNNICTLEPTNTLIFKQEVGTHYPPLHMPLFQAEASWALRLKCTCHAGSPCLEGQEELEGLAGASLPHTRDRGTVRRKAEASLVHIPGDISDRSREQPLDLELVPSLRERQL